MRQSGAIVLESPAGELVYSAPVAPSSLYDCLWYAWDDAQEESDRAYEAWCQAGGGRAYFVYRAAQDRADAAQDALAICHIKAIG